MLLTEDGYYQCNYEDLHGPCDDPNFADYQKEILVVDGLAVAEREKFGERFEDVAAYSLDVYGFRSFQSAASLFAAT